MGEGRMGMHGAWRGDGDGLEMDTKATVMLAKGLYAQKRKGKVPSGSSKRAKVGASSSLAPFVTAAAFKVVVSVKVLPTIEVGTVDADSMPSTPPGPSSGDQPLKLSTEGETREGKKKKKAVTKTPLGSPNAHPHQEDTPSRGGGREGLGGSLS
ncbi:hypothetical protein COCNU_scaffold001259G000040 [Cocos nucifera]|nr:hypothetical protein [Cocos nucifera]